MKRVSFFILFITMCVLNDFTLAQSTLSSPMNNGTVTNMPASSCLKLKGACEAAGYSEPGQSGKNLLIDCIKPAMLHQPVPGLKLEPGVIESCQKEIQNAPCMKILQTCHDTAGFNGAPGKLPMFDCLFPIYRGAQIPGVNPSPAELSACKAYIAKLLQDTPCLRIMLACKDAGYSPDSTINGQIFARNCFTPIISGKEVPGVVVDPGTVAACNIDMKTQRQQNP